MKPIIYGGRGDHLGSCLMNLAGAWRLAEALRLKFVSVWPDGRKGRPDMALRALYQDVPFDVINVAPPCDIRLYAAEQLDPAGVMGATTIWYAASGHLQLVGENASDVGDHARKLMQSLPLRPSIGEAVERVVAATEIAGKTAVHLRRGDLIDHVQRPANPRSLAIGVNWFIGKFAEIEAYVDAAEGADIVAFSDSSEEVERMRGLLPRGRLVAISEHSNLFAGLTSHQRDMAEMLIMSRAASVIQTNSNFSGFAAFYGNRPGKNVLQYIRPDRLAREVNRLFCPDVAELVAEAYHGTRKQIAAAIRGAA